MTLVHAQTNHTTPNTVNNPIQLSHDHQFLPYKHLRTHHLQQLTTILQDTTTSPDDKQSTINQTLKGVFLTPTNTDLAPTQQHALTELLLTTYTYTLQQFSESPLKQSTFVSLVVSVIEYSIQRTVCPMDDSKVGTGGHD